MLPRIQPMRPRLVQKPFDHNEYIFELKHDGFRAVVYIQNGECKILSRNQNALRFPSLKKSLAALPVTDAIIDGEIVCLDADGVSHFIRLLNHRKYQPILYAFDLLWIDGRDLRQLPLIQRKDQLQRLVRSSGCRELIYAQHVERFGKQIVRGNLRARSGGHCCEAEARRVQRRWQRLAENQK